jgi:hypothetical protein
LAGLVAACSPVGPQADGELRAVTGEIAGGRTVGQTIVARQDGLSAIAVLIADPGDVRRAPDGTLVMRLRGAAGPNAPALRDLRVIEVHLSVLRAGEYVRFDFAPLTDSAGDNYTVLLESLEVPAGAGPVARRAPGDAYADGALYLDGAPVDGQLAFRLDYAPEFAAAGRAAAAVMLLFLLPGLALLVWLAAPAGEGEWAGDWRAVLLVAPGVTLALLPVALLGARLVGLRLGAWAPWTLLVLGAAALLVALRRGRVRLVRPALEPSDAALLAVALLVVLVRFAVVRTLELPAWGDSVQHTVITQLLLDHGGLFESWEPYAPYESFTQQFGFPAASAFVAWLVGLPSPRAVVLAGQLVNALAALAVYPLAVRLGGRWAGVVAVLVAGLIATMPMMYVNWGRYPQLAGLAILPVAVWLLGEALNGALPAIGGPRRALGLIVLAGLAAAGMLLASYRMLHFFGGLVLAWFALPLLAGARRPARAAWRAAGQLALAGVVAGAVLLPWELRLPSGRLPAAFDATLTGVPEVERVLGDYQNWRLAPSYGPDWLLALAAVALVWAVVRRRYDAAAIGLWVAGLSAFTLLRLVRFPTAAFFDNFSVVIMLYLPAALLISWLAGELVAALTRRWPARAAHVALGAVLIAAALGTIERAHVIDDHFAIATRPDLEAFTWVREHVPADARFAVNGFTIWQDSSAVGSDGGWWLPVLGRRANLMPPQYALSSELEAVPGYSQSVVELVRTLAAEPPPAAPGLAALCRAGATHIYIGQKQGATGIAAGDSAVLRFDGQALAASPHFELLYRRDRVWIFALAPSACAAARGERATNAR